MSTGSRKLGRMTSMRYYVIISVLSLSISGCAWLPHAPSRLIPTPLPELALEIVQMPKEICIGDTATFIVRTKPGNECLGAVGYWNTKGSWVGPNFEPMIADQAGLCTWTWQVDDSAAPGIAEFRTVARGYGSSRDLIPRTFTLQNCER